MSGDAAMICARRQDVWLTILRSERHDPMSSKEYFSKVGEILTHIQQTQQSAIEKAAAAMAASIEAGGLVYLFGSGHSVIPVLDIFPRYGSFVGFCPIYDPRLMWFNVVGPGGARELLRLEREEGYAKNILASYSLEPRDSILVFSHGGLNAAPIEVALEAKSRGVKVVTVSSHQNRRQAKATHSSGKQLPDVADIAIDNCVPPEDALVGVDGIQEKFAAGSEGGGAAFVPPRAAGPDGPGLARPGGVPRRGRAAPRRRLWRHGRARDLAEPGVGTLGGSGAGSGACGASGGSAQSGGECRQGRQSGAGGRRAAAGAATSLPTGIAGYRGAAPGAAPDPGRALHPASPAWRSGPDRDGGARSLPRGRDRQWPERGAGESAAWSVRALRPQHHAGAGRERGAGGAARRAAHAAAGSGANPSSERAEPERSRSLGAAVDAAAGRGSPGYPGLPPSSGELIGFVERSRSTGATGRFGSEPDDIGSGAAPAANPMGRP